MELAWLFSSLQYIPLLCNYPVMASCSESFQPGIFILNVVSNLEQSSAENSGRPVWEIPCWKQAQWIEPVVRSDLDRWRGFALPIRSGTHIRFLPGGRCHFFPGSFP
jgi:hypothetical protein